MVKVLAWSVALYAAETWTLREDDISTLEAFEMWIWRKMEKISWRDHKKKYAGSTDGRRTTIADERNPSKTKELDWSYTPRKLTVENCSRRENGR